MGTFVGTTKNYNVSPSVMDLQDTRFELAVEANQMCFVQMVDDRLSTLDLLIGVRIPASQFPK